MKKTIILNLLFALVAWSMGFAQQEAWETHTRGLLHQSVFNTGALGVQYNFFRSAYTGDSLRTPFEWPGNSYFRYLNHDYWYYNSNGAGLALLCDTGRTGSRGDYLIADSIAGVGVKGLDMVGCLGLGGGGTYRDGTGMHWWPGSVSKWRNFPLNGDGTWNSSYDPTEAEEVITATVLTPYGITITLKSRAWSHPGYDSFIIYDYKFENTGDRFKGISNNTPDTLSELAISWVKSFFPSYVYANEQVNDFTTAASKELSRMDLKRWMQYVHSPDGRPEPTNYASWSVNGTNGGGLTAPAAVGYMMLYFDYDHLMPIASSRFISAIKTATNEQNYVYDPNGKFKQPWVVASSQANLSTNKILSHLQGSVGSRYAVWNPSNASVNDFLMKNYLTPQDSTYWYGRAKANANYNYNSPMVHSYALGPYLLPPHDAFHVVVADLAGFGPGRKSDAVYRDYGGGNEVGTVAPDMFHPVPSWDSVITYAAAPTSISSTGGIGIRHTPVYGLPAYLRDTSVVTIRDVADRAIQLYTGRTNVIKYDTSQYEPWGNTAATRYAPSPLAVAARPGGWNAGIKRPLPAPIADPFQAGLIISGVKWKDAVETIPPSVSPYIASGLHHYEVIRAGSALGPWTLMATVGRHDISYWDATQGKYAFADTAAKLGGTYYYAVVSVDSAGKKSGLENTIKIKADYRAYDKLLKVYAVPNPLFMIEGHPTQLLSSGNTKIAFYGLTVHTTIHVFSFSGQLLKTIHSDGTNQSIEWDLRTETYKNIASGVYYFTASDDDTGQKTWGKFVVIH